jgi:MFS family permease
MNSQNTPVHIHLWHRDFWFMAIANLLLTMSVYVQIPVLPLWMMQTKHLTMVETGIAMGAFAAGLFLLGGITSFLVQRYRRNMMCVWAILLTAGIQIGLYYIDKSDAAVFPVILLQRVLTGALFGVAQMILASTLIIDTSESFQRTEANHSASWFSRFALSLGPMAGILVYQLYGFEALLLTSVACAAGAVVLILFVHFPFRSPAENIQFFSFDRFFLPQSWPLFINLMVITVLAGMLMTTGLSEHFYGMMMAGFLLALLAQRFAFRDAELKSEVVSGLVLTGAALLMLLTRHQAIVTLAAPLFIGFGLGIIGSRFLLFFIKLSRHCQRGTSQSTFTLAWESGIALGIGIGYACLGGETKQVYTIALMLAVVALMMYNFVTHHWFLTHKNR